jgi:hypothetical protein
MIWVEVLSRHHVVRERHRCAGPEIRIGRSYDNDVVVDDPYVDPHHVRIVRTGTGGLVAEDLGSVNGLVSDQSSRHVERVEIDGNRLLRIGHTWLRIREASHAVAPARPAERRTRKGPMLAGLGAATLGLVALSKWASQTLEPRPSDYLLDLVTVGCIVLAWTGGWAVLSRIFSGHAGFERNLSIALGGALVTVVGAEAFGVASFALSWSMLATWSYVGGWALLAVVCFLHMRDMSAGRRWIKGSAAAALAVAGIGVQTLVQLEKSTDAQSTERISEIRHAMPPAFRLAPLVSEADFLASASGLKTRIDSDRTE